MNLLYVLVFTIVTAGQINIVCFASTTTNIVDQNTCSSRFHCQTPTMKYLSHSQLNGYYLNATIIARNRTSNISSCQKICIRTNGCFSININISLNKDYDCQLLSNSTNLYLNKSLLVKDRDFIHLFIRSPICDKKVCKNDATCIPNYSNDSYSCQCKKNATFDSWGGHCENAAKGAKAANLFWSFDQLDHGQFKSMTKKDGASAEFRILGMGKHLMMPGRLTSILYCNSTSGNGCAETSGVKFGLNDLRGVEEATYSIWLKFTQAELQRNIDSIIFASSNAMGAQFLLMSQRSNGFSFKVVTDTGKWQLMFAPNVLVYRWTHFAMTFKKSAGLCGYVNGVLDRCSDGMPIMQNTAFTSTAQYRLGFQSTLSHVSGIFIDDLAVWHSKALTESDVKQIYALGKP